MKNKKFNWEEEIGAARYIGHDEFLIKKFGNEFHSVCSCEGEYIRDDKGIQYIIENKREWEIIKKQLE